MSLFAPPAAFAPPKIDWRLLLPVLVCAAAATGVVASRANEALFLAANAMAATLLPDTAWAGITNLGSALGALCLLAPTLARWPRCAASALLATPFASLFIHVIKYLANVPRPAAGLAGESIHIIGDTLRFYAFPSGHSMTAFVLAGVLVLCAKRSWSWAWLALPVAALVAFSRLAVGAHWPLDLLVGAAGGWATAAIGCAWAERWRFWENVRGQRVLTAIIGVGALVFCFEDLKNPDGYWMQYTLCAIGIAGALYAGWRPAAARAAA
ncbi:MAG: phosphatase PAP2 family protein [Azoarcus sp.]|jgi:membrane-associated phospholipid phosphatase|nr:phosphatase PAP2 family protein [Azoarcus sp.]